MKKFIVIIVAMIAFSGCFKNYYRVNADPSWSVDKLKSVYQTHKTVIVHFKDDVKLMENPVVENNTIKGSLKNVYLDSRYMNPKPDRNNVYKYKHKEALFSQMHIYVNDSIGSDSSYAITEEKFKRAEIYVPNKGASVASHVGGVLAIAFVAAAAFTAIACNCPQVYVETGPAHFEFVSGMYSGAIMKTLERTDYLPLTGLVPTSDTVRVRITGMPGETQYVNHASLQELQHPEGTEIVGTRQGDLFVISHLQLPKKVIAANVMDRSKSVSFRDNIGYGFHLADSVSDNSQLILHYKRKGRSDKALLVARLKNTYWGGYVYKQFKGLYGNQYTTWIDQQEKLANNNMMDWQIQQGLVMKVSVWTPKGWVYRDYFPSAGNTASRDMALELDLRDVEDEEVQIKLESAYRFWEIDQVGLSFDFNTGGVPQLINANTALVNGSDVADLVRNGDDRYVTLHPSDQMNLEFINKSQTLPTGMNRTYVLAMGGFYHQASENDKAPQARQLMEFRTPGKFHRFSMEKYKELGLIP